MNPRDKIVGRCPACGAADEYDRDARLVDSTQADELLRFADRLRALAGSTPDTGSTP